MSGTCAYSNLQQLLGFEDAVMKAIVTVAIAEQFLCLLFRHLIVYNLDYHYLAHQIFGHVLINKSEIS